ncbi:unnamed protein product [Merluccius merluccius]
MRQKSYISAVGFMRGLKSLDATAAGCHESPTAHPEVSNAGRPTVKQPAGAGVTQESPPKPPVVRVRGAASAPPSSSGGPWSLALLLPLAILGLQWTSF